MKNITKYQGVIPAFYACYDAEGNISTEGTVFYINGIVIR